MKEYLYIFNYPPYEKELCKLEFEYLFKEKMNHKYHITTLDINHNRSVFMRSKIDIFIKSCHFDDLEEYVKSTNMTYYEFKVIYLKNEITHVPYKESIDKCKRIALPINGSVNISNPKVIIVITKINDEWILGLQHLNTEWNKHENKPYTYSYSLSLRLARSLVNIAIGNDLSLKVVDPCCGIGTVVLEALSMGVHIKGYDISREVSYQARLNLEYFGYNPLVVVKKDMHDIDEEYDVCIMDIPYGLYSNCSYDEQIGFLKAALKFSKKLILITLKKMDEELMNMGYNVENCCEVGKNESFSMVRYVTVCRRNEL